MYILLEIHSNTAYSSEIHIKYCLFYTELPYIQKKDISVAFDDLRKYPLEK